MCGKQASLRNFDPESFANNIYVQKVRGLGRGRGFKVTSSIPIFDKPDYDGIREMIANRAIELLATLERNGDVSLGYILTELGLDEEREALEAKEAIEEENQAEHAISEEKIGALSQTVEKLNSENLTGKQEIQTLMEKISGLEQHVKSAEAATDESRRAKDASESSKEESEAVLSSIESDTASLLRRLGLPTIGYRGGVEEMLDAVEQELLSLDVKIDRLLDRMGLSPTRYDDLGEKIEAIADEVAAARALNE